MSTCAIYIRVCVSVCVSDVYIIYLSGQDLWKQSLKQSSCYYELRSDKFGKEVKEAETEYINSE